MRSPRNLAKRREAGFTLVEAMISLFVFSLIASGCVLMLMQSVDSQARVSEAHERLREVQAARALLAGDLAQYAPRLARDADGRGRPVFIGGDADIGLGFVRASAEPDPVLGTRTGLQLVEYRLRDGQLVRASRAEIDAGPDVEMSERVVLSGIEGGRFEFYDGAVWREQWLSPFEGAPPPRAVALVFTSARYGPLRITALVAASA